MKEQKILRKIATAKVSAVERFVARDNLEAANIGGWSKLFDKLFMDMVEENVGSAVVTSHMFMRKCTDAPILNELGFCAEIKLAHFFQLIERQRDGKRDGKDGFLQVTGTNNGAHIRGSDGNLWNMHALFRQDEGCWWLLVHPIVLDPSDTCSPKDSRLLSYDFQST